jgi:hypothetical protein
MLPGFFWRSRRWSSRPLNQVRRVRARLIVRNGVRKLADTRHKAMDRASSLDLASGMQIENGTTGDTARPQSIACPSDYLN